MRTQRGLTTRPMLGLAGTLLLALASPSCGDPLPTWTAIPGGPLDTTPTPPTLAGRTPTRVVDDAGTWIRTTIERADWTHTPEILPGLWSTSVGITGIGAPTSGASQRLVGAGFTGRHRPALAVGAGTATFEPGDFHAGASGVALVLADDAPPPTLALWVYAGRTDPTGGRVMGHRYSGDGIALVPPEVAQRTVDVPANAVLHFATTLEPLWASADASAGSVTFRVALDGVPLLEHVEPDTATARARWHAIPLPPEARGSATLEFQVEGAPCYAAFLAPRIGPADIGRPGARPWEDPRRDLVIFVADTFRADNMAAYGGPGWTPRLDAAAEHGALFRNAWATSTWTLPSHASLLTSVYPGQAGIAGDASRLPDDWTTLAEHLAERGWRTGAVTESAWVSQVYGVDQGFEWWNEDRGTFEDTLASARAFLDADDGRPTFLLVQTYRVHTPYVVSDRTRAELADLLAAAGPLIEGTWQELNDALSGLMGRRRTEAEVAHVAALLGGLRALYRGGSADLDRGFGDLWDDLERRGFTDHGYLLVTSDHGEGFFEHDAMYHRARPWEELARIPFFLVGPGVEPGTREDPASLIDVPPTIAALLEVDRRAEWIGRDLFERGRAPERPLLVFECTAAPGASVAVLLGQRKVLVPEDPDAMDRGELIAAFDLGLDPGETIDLAGDEFAWPREHAQRFAGAVREALTPLTIRAAARTSVEKRNELKGLGYTGDED